jgi:hypothetical protein
VFSAIREDENDHVGTMQSCLDPGVVIRAPSLEKRVLLGLAFVSTAAFLASAGLAGGELDSSILEALTGTTPSAGLSLMNANDAVSMMQESNVATDLTEAASSIYRAGLDEAEISLLGTENSLTEAGLINAMTSVVRRGMLNVARAIALLLAG